MPTLDQSTSFLLAVAVITGGCGLLGALCARFRQPPVLGKLTGALLLGPSLFGALAPGAHAALSPLTCMALST